MLMEVRTKDVMSSTNGPVLTIFENDELHKNMINEAKAFILNAFHVTPESYYIIVVEAKATIVDNINSHSGSSITTASNTTKDRAEYKYTIRVVDNSEHKTSCEVHGNISITSNLNVMKFVRDYTIDEIVSNSGIKEDFTIPGTYIDSRPNIIEISTNSTPKLELSPDSFTAEGRSIEVSCPEMGIGSVENSSFNIDEERQSAQDAFLKTMSDKFNRSKKSRKY